MKRIILPISLVFGLVLNSRAQYVSLPLGLLPMQYNDAFAGSVGNSRIVVNGTFSYYDDPSMNMRGNGLYASFDSFWPGIRSGFGLSANRAYKKVKYISSLSDRGYEYIETQVAVALAPKISFKGKYTLSPSINLSFISHDYFDTNDSFYESGLYSGLSSRVGLLFNAKRYYVAYSVRLFEAESLKRGGIYDFDFYSVFQVGYVFQKNEGSKFSFSPQLAIVILGREYTWNRIVLWPEYNLGFRYNNLVFGIIGRAYYFIPTGFSFGWQNKDWRVMLSNDFFDSFRSDLTLRYIFGQDKKSKFVQY